MLIVAYLKFYNHSEHLAICEVIVVFKAMVAFKQYIPKKHRCFITKNYKLYDTMGCTYDMERQKTCYSRHDSNTCCSETTDKRSKGA
jgi:hypothetical protein